MSSKLSSILPSASTLCDGDDDFDDDFNEDFYDYVDEDFNDEVDAFDDNFDGDVDNDLDDDFLMIHSFLGKVMIQFHDHLIAI